LPANSEDGAEDSRVVTEREEEVSRAEISGNGATRAEEGDRDSGAITRLRIKLVGINAERMACITSETTERKREGERREEKERE